MPDGCACKRVIGTLNEPVVVHVSYFALSIKQLPSELDCPLSRTTVSPDFSLTQKLLFCHAFGFQWLCISSYSNIPATNRLHGSFIATSLRP